MKNFSYVGTNSFIVHMLYEYFNEHASERRENFELILSKCAPARNLLSKYVLNTSFNIVNENGEPLSFLTISQALGVMAEDENYNLLSPDDMLITFSIILARLTVVNFNIAVIIGSDSVWNLEEAFDSNKSELFYMLRYIYREPQIVKYTLHDKKKIINKIILYLLPKYMHNFLPQDNYQCLIKQKFDVHHETKARSCFYYSRLGIVTMLSFNYIKVCIFIFIAEIILLIVFSTPEYISRVMAVEGVKIENALGGTTLARVDAQSSVIFNTVYIDSKVYPSIWHMFIPTEDEKMHEEGLEDLASGLFNYVEDRITVLSYLLFQLIHRLTLLFYWLPSCIIITALSFYSGLMLRKIKKGNFAFASPSMHRMSIKLILIFLTLLPLFLMCPIPLSPYMYPIMYICISFMIMAIVANIAKRV